MLTKLTSFPRTLSSNWVSLKCTFVIRGLKNKADSVVVAVFRTSFFRIQRGVQQEKMEKYSLFHVLLRTQQSIPVPGHPPYAAPKAHIRAWNLHALKVPPSTHTQGHSYPNPPFLPQLELKLLDPGATSKHRNGWEILLYSFHGQKIPEQPQLKITKKIYTFIATFINLPTYYWKDTWFLSQAHWHTSSQAQCI